MRWSAIDAAAGTGSLVIGGETFRGRIDEVRIYDRALDEGELAADKATPIETPPSSPVAAYSFDEGEGEIAHDNAGEHDGTLEGAAWFDGIAGPALGFDGEEDCLAVPHSSDLELTEEFTIATWALREGSGVDEPLIFTTCVSKSTAASSTPLLRKERSRAKDPCASAALKN